LDKALRSSFEKTSGLILKAYIWLTFLLYAPFLSAQNYQSWIVGDALDANVVAEGGICLMGGASDNDDAMRWFLQQCNGGDVLVLRASGADGYNNYLFSDLGVAVNSVETILFNNAAASNETYVKQRIEQAEGIWIAGGDQWNYVSYWRDTPVDSLINKGIAERNMVIGGTSAGMAIQGEYYFTAQNGTVSSATALSNPYNASVTTSNLPFIENPYLQGVITDTHYDNPDRKGRHMVFLARTLQDQQQKIKGIACDEYTAVCIDTDGVARVFGEYPSYDDNAYFLQVNCELSDPSPESCQSGMALTWNHNGEAVKVYRVRGTTNGSNTFDLKDWKTGNGGTWLHWGVNSGVLSETLGTAPNCPVNSIEEQANMEIVLFPNPSENGSFSLISEKEIKVISVQSADGKSIDFDWNGSDYSLQEDFSGICILKCQCGADEYRTLRLIVR
jgi:cyanophycinase-like exopeptidase